MDLITQLAGSLGIDDNQAQALAGAVVGKVTGAVQDEAGDDAAAQVTQALPELSGWKAKAAEMLSSSDDSDDSEGGEGGGLLGALTGGAGGGLLGAAAGALGGKDAKDTVAIVGILGKLNIDASKATLVAPLVLSFLKDRLNPTLLSTVLAAAPMLTGGSSDSGSSDSGSSDSGSTSSGGLGAAADALGGLFGRR